MLQEYDSLNTLLNCDESQQQMYMPNEIFVDLMGNEKLRARNGRNLAFAYSFYYLTSWLYRNCKYGNVFMKEKAAKETLGYVIKPINVEHIKEMLGYSPTYRNIDYIIKKNGALEELGYIYGTTDYPVSWSYEEGETLEFYRLSNMSKEDRELNDSYGLMSRNYKIKYPVKAFYRSKESVEEEYEDGTFYEIARTFYVPFEVLNFCMKDKRLGVSAFYLWSYLKYKNQWHSGAYYASRMRLISETGLSNEYLDEILDMMKRYNMITAKVEQDFVMGLHEDYRRPISYIANDPFDLNEPFYPMPTKEYEKAKTISLKEHMDRIREEQMRNEICDVKPVF